jgi:hypothetical protein
VGVRPYRHIHEADVVVFGAGPAGIAASIAAARRKQRVCLVEVQNVIGGVMSSCPGMMLGSGYPTGQSIGGLFEEFVTRMYEQDPPAAQRRRCDLANFGDEVVYDHEYAMTILADMLHAAGVDVLLNHIPFAVHVERQAVAGVDVAHAGGDMRFSAASYVDCTGNGDVAVKAGVPFQKGDKYGRMMGGTLTFFMEGVDWDQAFADESDPYHTELAEKGIAEGSIHDSLRQVYYLKGFHEGSVYFNTVTMTDFDGTDNASVVEATRVARHRVEDLVRFVKREFPGFARSHLAVSGRTLGVRETRRLEGLYTLTHKDIARATKFEDGVVACDSPFDEVFRDEGSAFYSHEAAVIEGEYYTIPFRSLVPKSVRNLLFAGRHRSVDLKAYASGRGMPQCMGMGQSCGVGATMANSAGCAVQDVDRRQLVETLCADGVLGIGPAA